MNAQSQLANPWPARIRLPAPFARRPSPGRAARSLLSRQHHLFGLHNQRGCMATHPRSFNRNVWRFCRYNDRNAKHLFVKILPGYLAQASGVVNSAQVHQSPRTWWSSAGGLAATRRGAPGFFVGVSTRGWFEWAGQLPGLLRDWGREVKKNVREHRSLLSQILPRHEGNSSHTRSHTAHECANHEP